MSHQSLYLVITPVGCTRWVLMEKMAASINLHFIQAHHKMKMYNSLLAKLLNSLSGDIFLWLSPWFHALKKVHGGLPTNQVGRSCSTMDFANRRSDGFEKSQCSPSGLAVRMSMARSPLMFKLRRHPCEASMTFPCSYISKKEGS